MAIKTPDQRLRVFISSTMGELADERAAAAHAIEALRLFPVMFELGARPHPPRDLYRAYLDQSHVFVGIYWEKYGWVAPDMDISGLEDEYRLASDKPKLIYIKEPAANREERLTSLIGDIRTDNVSYKLFATPDELAALLKDDLAGLLSERFESALPTTTIGAEQEHAGALPVQVTPFIGRDWEVAEVVEMLRKPTVRLVTLTGPGGVGKTRVALEVASRMANDFPDGIRLVSLSSVLDSHLVPAAIAKALGLIEAPEDLPLARLKTFLKTREMLVILDNFEQVVEAAPLMVDLLTGSPGLRFLVTSRALLQVRGEREFAVGGMKPPDLPAWELIASLDRGEGVRLFAERARAVNPGFELTESNVAAIVEICERLDWLPLAIELAAARSRLLPPERMLEKMTSSIELGVGHRDLPERQRSLRNALDWDFGLLDPGEQSIFRRLSVFAGGFALESAEAVLAGYCEPVTALSGIESLATKSLLRQDESQSVEVRFGMLRTIREYAFDKLTESGEADELQRRHATYFLEVAITSSRRMRTPEQAAWLDRLEREHANMRTALSWSFEHDADLFLRLSVALGHFWEFRSYLTEGRFWLDRALSKEADPVLRANVLDRAGTFARGQGEFERAAGLLEECVVIRRILEDDHELALSLKNLGNVMLDLGELDRAYDLYEESLAIRRRIDDVRGMAETLNNLGVLARFNGNWELAVQHYKEARPLFERLNDTIGAARVLMNLAEARLEQGDHQAALSYVKQSLKSYVEVGSRWDIADCLEIIAAAATVRGEPTQAARLFGAAEALRDSLGTPLPPSERETYDRRLMDVRSRLDGTTFAIEWAWGRELDVDEAVRYALR